MYDDPPAPPAPEQKPPAMFTQEQLNFEIGKARQKANERVVELTTQLQELSGRTDLTVAEKEDLQRQMEETRNQYMTEKQRAAANDADWKKRYDTDVTKSKQEADTWKSRFETQQINAAILSAAQDPEINAFMPNQMLALLRGDSKLAPVLDEDGKPTDEYQVMVRFQDVDPKTKKTVDLNLPVAEAMKRMRQQPEKFGNLFRHNKVDGIGFTDTDVRRTNSGDGPPLGPGVTQEQYDAWVDKHPNWDTGK